MLIKRGSIVVVDLDGFRGSEQGGVRPAVVVQNDIGNRHSTTTIIVPLSSKSPKIPTHVPVEHPSLPCRSTALCEQVRVVDRCRISRVVGYLNGKDMERIDRALHVALGLSCGGLRVAL